jgi:hypothetical protein
MCNALADAGSPFTIPSLTQVRLLSAAKIAPLSKLVVIERIAFLVGAALVHAVSNGLAGRETRVGNNFKIGVPE